MGRMNQGAGAMAGGGAGAGDIDPSMMGPPQGQPPVLLGQSKQRPVSRAGEGVSSCRYGTLSQLTALQSIVW
jgi:hypothetical protein